MIPRASEALFVLQHIRDEAHRIAVSVPPAAAGEAGAASRRSTTSPASVRPGRRRSCRRFGSLARLRRRLEDEIAETPGIGPELAQSIYERLHDGPARATG